MQSVSRVQQVFNSDGASARITLEQLFVSIKQADLTAAPANDAAQKYNASTMRSLDLLKQMRKEYAPMPERKTCIQRAVENTIVYTYSDRTQIVKDNRGNILKTRDAGNLKREFLRDGRTGEIRMRTFGRWRKLTSGERILEDGTFVTEDEKAEIHQKLDGTTLVICKNNGAVIETNHLRKTDIAVYPNGQVLIKRLNACGNEEQIVLRK